jgi:branched-chain amino acid aminotransferase
LALISNLGGPTAGAAAVANYAGRVPLTTTRSTAATRTLSVWVDGALLSDPSQPVVAANDHGLVVGDGVFEVLKITEAGPFAVQRHLDRLSRSAGALGLPAPDHSHIRAAIHDVLAAGREGFRRLRITYTGGRGPLASNAAYGPPTLVVAAEAAERPPATGIVVTAPWTRNERGALAGVKSISYAENVRALGHARAHEATEAIFVNTAGNISEGTGTNIFFVLGEAVVTPPLSSGALAGITRELVLEWCDVEERDLTLTEALKANEVFLTSSMRDIQPVRRWDDTDFDPSHPLTDKIAAIFAERSTANLDP